MGDVVEAQTFSYRLEVGAHGRKLIWEGTPRSIRDSHHKVRDSHDGLIIQRNMALFSPVDKGRSSSFGSLDGFGRPRAPRLEQLEPFAVMVMFNALLFVSNFGVAC